MISSTMDEHQLPRKMVILRGLIFCWRRWDITVMDGIWHTLFDNLDIVRHLHQIPQGYCDRYCDAHLCHAAWLQEDTWQWYNTGFSPTLMWTIGSLFFPTALFGAVRNGHTKFSNVRSHSNNVTLIWILSMLRVETCFGGREEAENQKLWRSSINMV